MATKTVQKKRKAGTAEATSSTKKPRTSKTTTAVATTQDAQAEAGLPAAETKSSTAADEITFDPDSDAASSASEDVEDRTAALLEGFENLSDSDAEAETAAATGSFDASTLPDPSTAVTKAKKANSSALSKKAAEDSSDPTVLYISRIPHGFFEPQMRAYFSQFGDIKHLRLARNRRTGASKHYAFIEFKHAEVAAIVQKTMDNYLMLKHILKVRFVPKEKVHPDLWKGADRRFRKIPWNRIEKNQISKTDRKGWSQRVEREAKRREEKAAKLKALGYDFEAPELREVDSVPIRIPQEPVKAVEASDDGAAKAVTEAAEDGPVKQIAATANDDEGVEAVAKILKDRKSGKSKADRKTKSQDAVKVPKKSRKAVAA